MDYYGKSRELSQEFQKCIKIYSDMLGNVDESKKSSYGFVPGLRKPVAAKDLNEQLARLQEGIFQVLFTGVFSAGKSTLLNSLMHKKVLRMNINAETAVVSKIIFGYPETVQIVSKTIDKSTNQPQIIEMSLKQFFEEYRVDQDNPEKFVGISHVVIHQPGDGIGGRLVQLVDSPGTNNSNADTLAAREFAEHASAIVYMINSTQAFQLDDKEYIKSHYEGRHMRNVFFVCNWFDALTEQAQREDLKKRARDQLREVFTDKHGRFDEELFRKRVFYTDAYHSLYARLGEPIKAPYGVINCDDSLTGVPEFEKALNEYLTAEDRDKEAFRGYMPQLAGRYIEALNAIDEILDQFQKEIGDLQKEQSDIAGKKRKLEAIIEQIGDSCRSCLSGILASAKDKYYSCIGDISSGWDKHFGSVDIDFGILDMTQLAWYNGNDDKVREITKPFADEVQSYIKEKFEDMLRDLAHDLKGHLTILEKQLNIQQQQLDDLELPISVDTLRQSLLGTLNMKNPNIDTGKMQSASLFQIILGIIGMDPDIIMGGVGGNSTNFEAIIKFLIKNIFEYIALYAVAWPIGLAMIVARIWDIIRGMKSAKHTRAQEILLKMRDKTVDALRLQQESYIMELEDKLSELTSAGRKTADSLKSQIDSYTSGLQSTIDQLRSNENSIKAETERTGKIRKILLDSLSSVNELLNGSKLTEKDIRVLAVKKG